jgi:hypothetical protein
MPKMKNGFHGVLSERYMSSPDPTNTCVTILRRKYPPDARIKNPAARAPMACPALFGNNLNLAWGCALAEEWYVDWYAIQNTKS